MDGTSKNNPYPELHDSFNDNPPPQNPQLSKYTTKEYAGFLKNNVNISRPPNSNEINKIDDFGFVKVEATATVQKQSSNRGENEEN